MKRSTLSSARCFPKGSDAASVLSRSGRCIGGKMGGRRPFLRKSCVGCRVFACLEEGLRKSSASLREDAQLGAEASCPPCVLGKRAPFLLGYHMRLIMDIFSAAGGKRFSAGKKSRRMNGCLGLPRGVGPLLASGEILFRFMRNGPRRQGSLDENAFCLA